MDPRRLRYFIAVAEELNFRRAAARLHLAQSPLSQQIRKLEEELNVQLFKRSNRRVELTHAGSVFLAEARALVSRSREAAHRAQSAAEGKDGVLRVGYLTSMTNERFSKALTAFRRDCPDVDLALHDLVPDAIAAGVRERTLDVGFIRAPLHDEELHAHRVWREKLVVALPKDHWLAGRGAIRPKNLAEETFVMVPDAGSMGFNEVIRMMCLDAGFTPRRRIEANQMQAAVWLVHLGFGISVVAESLQGLHRDNVVYQPIHRSPEVGAHMIWRKDNHSEVLARFVRTMQDALRGRIGSR